MEWQATPGLDYKPLGQLWDDAIIGLYSMSSFEGFKTSKMLSFTHSFGHVFLIQLQGIYFHLQSRKGRVTGKTAIREKGYSTKSATGGGTPPPLGYIILIPIHRN